MTTWKMIPGVPGHEVSSEGEVRQGGPKATTAKPDLLEAMELLLGWANIQDDHSAQAVQLRDTCRAAIAAETERRKAVEEQTPADKVLAIIDGLPWDNDPWAGKPIVEVVDQNLCRGCGNCDPSCQCWNDE